MFDVLSLVEKKRVEIGEYGFIELIDCMPRIGENKGKFGPGDVRIIEAARKSVGEDRVTGDDKDIAFLRMMMRNQHTSPFEMVEFTWNIRMPIFTMRQWIRHRTANVNEFSARYAQLENEFYVPPIDDVRIQSKTNKQGSEGSLDKHNSETFINALKAGNRQQYIDYQNAIDCGIAKEQARFGMPVNSMTECIWKIDLKNLLHFLRLRCDSHAQKEIRDYANIMLDQVELICPVTIQAWEDYDSYRQGMLLSRLEVEYLRNLFGGLELTNHGLVGDGISKREQTEWATKWKRLAGK